MPIEPLVGEASRGRAFEAEIPRAVGRIGVAIDPADDGLIAGVIESTENLPVGPVTEIRKFSILPSKSVPEGTPRGVGEIFEGRAVTERAVQVRVRVNIGGPVRVTVTGEQPRIRIRNFDFDPRNVAAR